MLKPSKLDEENITNVLLDKIEIDATMSKELNIIHTFVDETKNLSKITRLKKFLKVIESGLNLPPVVLCKHKLYTPQYLRDKGISNFKYTIRDGRKRVAAYLKLYRSHIPAKIV